MKILSGKIVLPVCMILIMISQLNAEPAGITLEEAVKTALENNYDYKIARLRMLKSDEKVNEVWGQLMPVLESEASIVRQNAESGFMSLSDGQTEIKFVQMKFGINPGLFYNALQTSRKNYSSSIEEMRRIKGEIEYNVIKSYFDLILANEMILLKHESLDVLRNNLNDVKNMFKAGVVPEYELLQANVLMMNQESELNNAVSAGRVALDMFNHILGTGRNLYTVKQDVVHNEVKPVTGIDPEKKIDMLTSIALKNRPEVIQIRKKIEMAEHAESMYSSYYLWPSFSVGGYYGMSKYDPNEISQDISTPMGPITPDFSGISGTDEWQNTWQVKFAATYRWGALFPADSVRSLERKERLNIKEGEQELARLKSAISVYINSSYSKLLTAYMTINSQKENIKTAKEGLRIARESYRAGVIKNSELLASELALTSARTSYINSLYSYYLALAELKRETGLEYEKIIPEE